MKYTWIWFLGLGCFLIGFGVGYFPYDYWFGDWFSTWFSTNPIETFDEEAFWEAAGRIPKGDEVDAPESTRKLVEELLEITKDWTSDDEE